MKKICLFLLATIWLSLSFGQNQMANYYYDEGKTAYDEEEYEEALEGFEKALEKDPQHQNALYYSGFSHYNLKQYPQAVERLEQLEKSHPDSWAWFYYIRGRAQEKLERWADASKSYATFLEKYSRAAKYDIYRHQGRYRKRYVEQSPKIRAQQASMKDPITLGTAVNTISDDMMPQVDPTGRRLYFTSSRKGGFDNIDEDEENDWGEDLYYIEREGNGWSKAVLLPEPINSYNNDGTSTFSADGQTMIYVKCGEEGGIGSCDLWVAHLEGDQWTKPENMGNVINTEDWESQPTLSADGSTLIFTSSRDGGYGDEDLYICRRDRFGAWGVPVNMGSTINTPFPDKSPYLAPDGKTLYFSSKGHPGHGDFDLFVSVFENGSWSEPLNMGKPLNSSGSDVYFTISASGEQAYFATDREKKNKIDLYQIEIPERMRPKPSVIVKGKVSDSKTDAAMQAWVLVEDINTGELIATTKSNSLSGDYLVVLPSGRNYSVSANKEGYFFYSNKFEVPPTAKYEEITKNIALKPIEKGARVVLNNIFFETGKANLTEESYIELAKAVALLKANPKMKVEVGGHTDNVGSDEANMKLSHERAKAVRDYLVKAGIADMRLQAKGYGETEPVASNDTDEGRKANRRTEFVILENG